MESDKKNVHVDLERGLNRSEVLKRLKRGQVNQYENATTKTIPQILKTNLFTLFNLVNLVLVILLLLVKSYRNMLFVLVAFINLVIGIVNEIRAKKIIDKLSLLVTNKTTVIRDGKVQKIDEKDIVLDDLVLLNLGDQVIVDATILEGEIEVNQSFITGEERAVFKTKGDTVLSGSYVISGNCKCQVSRVGKDNFTSKITDEVKYIKKSNSEIMLSLKKIIKMVTFIIVPFGLAIFVKQYFLLNSTIDKSIIAMTAAIESMIPNGLVLLTSTVMAVGVIRLNRYKVLIQELYCIETLARVDVICLDKTGTLTEGKMEVVEAIPHRHHRLEELEDATSNIVRYLNDNNATSVALRQKYNSKNVWDGSEKIPFSSKRKFSGATFVRRGTYLIGAPEILLKDQYATISKEVEGYAENYRVLALVHTMKKVIDDDVPSDVETIGFILIRDKIRKSAKKTLDYFKVQGVDVKIISGDNAKTITNIAERLNISSIKVVDMTTVNDEDIPSLILHYNVFARSTPEQKKVIVQELQKKGHVVAMTGDGVNDVLALRQADCSIAMASGSAASRNVSQLVLLNSNFDSLPEVVLEGRKAINNIEKTSALFLSKTIYAIALVIIFFLVPLSYPFSPIQLTLLGVTTIGIPSFYLGLQPNHDVVTKDFFKNILKKCLPSSLTMIVNVLIIAIVTHVLKTDHQTVSTLCLFSAGTIGFLLLYELSLPFDVKKRILFVSMLTIFIFNALIFHQFFNIVILNGYYLIFLLIMILFSFVLHKVLSTFINKIMYKKN